MVHWVIVTHNEAEIKRWEEVKTLLGNLPDSVCNAVGDKYCIEGQQITRETIQIMLKEHFQKLNEKINSISSGTQSIIVSSESTEMPDGCVRSARYQQGWHMWNGAFHPVPSNFKFDTYCTKDHWNNWLLGNPQNGEHPHRLITSCLDLRTKSERTAFSKVKTIMKLLMEIAMQAEPPYDIDGINTAASSKKYF